VLARCAGDGLREGEHIRVRLVEADPQARKVTFEQV
jgi:hypothetical protein